MVLKAKVHNKILFGKPTETVAFCICVYEKLFRRLERFLRLDILYNFMILLVLFKKVTLIFNLSNNSRIPSNLRRPLYV